MKWMRKQQLLGYLFILPSVTGITLFFFVPLIFTIALSFTSWRGPTGIGTEFIGLQNFQRLFNDEIFYTAFGNTIIYLLHVPVAVILGFIIANILNKRVFMKSSLRAMFFFTLPDK
ncbi:carbohydrate ABC transporter permease [Anaerobacillus sp. CMMVII]|uniref:carbohydrate ABC transporter permease n=1 Tax=Anaerobacillus sp. CMMVII TaxID=2755588 RepID=UPI0021B7FBAA|nr:hypothetical protein [Anaerobacillus sp. CMMVII]